MVEGAGVAGAELVSGAAGVAGAAGAGVLSGADELGGGTGPMRVFVSGAAAGEVAGAEESAGAAVEVAGPEAVRMSVLDMELFPFRPEAILHLRMGDVEIDNEGGDEEQNTRRQDNGTLEKHKGRASYQLKT